MSGFAELDFLSVALILLILLAVIGLGTWLFLSWRKYMKSPIAEGDVTSQDRSRFDYLKFTRTISPGKTQYDIPCFALIGDKQAGKSSLGLTIENEKLQRDLTTRLGLTELPEGWFVTDGGSIIGR